MSDRIPPALSPEEWRGGENTDATVALATTTAGPLVVSEPWAGGAGGDCVEVRPGDLPAVIALANAALPDGDPRKITPAHVALLRSTAREFETPRGYVGDGPALLALADLLAALLPPEAP